MARKSKYETPELDLKPEAPEVLSRDFNLFYRPEAEPLPAGLKEFASALDSFSQKGAVQATLLSEKKVKKSEGAKALKDHIELKLKFRDAVKDGKIDKNANPYYLEKYKELTLNQFANEFSDHVLKKYQDLKVGENITEGAFDSFYKDELKAYIKKNKLGFFKPEELEKSFFKETSEYRNQLEATHKQNLLENFNKSFDAKLKNRIVGVITKFKNYDSSILNIDDTETDKFDKIAEALQKEVGDLIDTTGDGKATIDTIFDGLALYVQTTEDYEFALELLQQIPKKLIGGTDSIAKVGRIKNKTDELTQLLIKSQNERLKNKVNFEKLKDEETVIETYNLLDQKVKEAAKKSTEFSITKWKNEDGRSDAERDAAEKYIQDQRYSGGTQDNYEVIIEIENLIKEEKWIEAYKRISKGLVDGDITKATLNTYKFTTIPNAREMKGNPYFEIPYIKRNFEAWAAKISSGKLGGDITKAVLAQTFLRKHLLQWLKDNQNLDKYKDNTSLLQNDFVKEFDQHIMWLKTLDDYSNLFGTGIKVQKGKTALETLESKITKAKKADSEEQDTEAQKIIEMQKDLNSKMNSADFQSKHKMTKEMAMKKYGLTQK